MSPSFSPYPSLSLLPPLLFFLCIRFKVFEFNDADQRGALDCIDYWVDLYAKGRSNISPEKIPWVALRTILGNSHNINSYYIIL